MSIDTFRKTRVQQLAKTRALQQKRIFTNWVNAQLELAEQASYEEPFISGYFNNGFSADSIESKLAIIFKEGQSLYRVRDLYNDLSDGRVLLRLLEIFTGRKISKSRGTMRVHWLENVGKALDQMKQMNIPHENIGPNDIVDGNSHLILGLIWIFILNFQLARLPFIRQLDSESPLEMKNALLRWCQLKTAVYPQSIKKTKQDSMACEYSVTLARFNIALNMIWSQKCISRRFSGAEGSFVESSESD
ncbi:unnamed protein product [Rodentolepis nana]|uniref:Calponin-homology (CH) domain-containing protein n=1 Tax=Rodentolepis nana TaxID=102285 RepID=A0A0R3T5C9_RODNA|nr:unnamed protein product [Rodentolepis nana]